LRQPLLPTVQNAVDGKRHKPQAGYVGLEWSQSSSFLNSRKLGPEAELWRGHRMFSPQGYSAPEIAKARPQLFYFNGSNAIAFRPKVLTP